MNGQHGGTADLSGVWSAAQVSPDDDGPALPADSMWSHGYC